MLLPWLKREACSYEVSEKKRKAAETERNTDIMHGVSTLQGGKGYQRLARLHWAAAVL